MRRIIINRMNCLWNYSAAGVLYDELALALYRFARDTERSLLIATS